jgi:hypothetical protein
VIQRKGYKVETAGMVASLSIAPDASCAVGDWMVLVVTWAATAPPSAPSGWTVLADSGAYGTRSTMVYARVRQSGDSSYTVPLQSGVNAAQAVLMWGSGHEPIDTWVVGPGGSRASNATATTTVAPSIAIGPGTALAISAEATTADESSVSVTGAVPWFFAPQGASPLLHTCSVSYVDRVTMGNTGPVTVTYPNTQASNGWAIQIGLASTAPANVPGAPVELWTGTALVQATASVWTGSAEVPASAVEVVPGTPVVSGDPAPGLPFALDPMALKQSPKKVFAHYFGPYPISTDNATYTSDSYHNAFLNPTYSTYAQYGGWFRDRPLPRPKLAFDYMSVDAATDIVRAHNAGLDGFFVDLLGLSGTNWNNYTRLANKASEIFPGGEFKVIPMVDANGATGLATPTQAAQNIAWFANLPSAWFLDDGRFVVSSFKADGKSVDWWTQVATALRNNHGLEAAYLHVFLNYNNAASYSSINWGSSSWGWGSDPTVTGNVSNQAAAAHGRGEVYMSPIQPQSARPTSSLFDEAWNTRGHRAAWEKAINDGAEYVQLVTWSDYSENGQFAPSAVSGYCNLDIGSYYLTRFKTGSYPTILRDAIYLSHRNQPMDATITGGQTKRMAQWQRGGTLTPVKNEVEALVFLTAPATVAITVGGVSTNFSAGAGMSSFSAPLRDGTVSAKAVRSSATVAEVTSPVPVQSAVPRDDPMYFQFSSIRGTSQQYKPYYGTPAAVLPGETANDIH